MPRRTEPGEQWKIFESVKVKLRLPSDKKDCPKFILQLMDGCLSEGKRRGINSGALANISGDWFERCVTICIEQAFGKENYQTEGDIGNINELYGFELEKWMPFPDIVIRNKEDFRAAISCKWGLRPDRRYSEPYVSMRLKRIRPSLRYLVVTNDIQIKNVQMLVDAPEIDRVYHLRRDDLAPRIDGKLYSFPDMLKELGLILHLEPRI